MHLFAFHRRVGFLPHENMLLLFNYKIHTTRFRGLNVGQKSVEQCFLLPSSNSEKVFFSGGLLIAAAGRMEVYCCVLFGSIFTWSVGYKINQSSSFAPGTFYSSSTLLFPLTVSFNVLVVYLEDGSFLTIFNRSILQSVSIFFTPPSFACSCRRYA